ncbi:MAG: MBL fold metallo-hydrolase [Clostridia bacterium]|nr:MBL fold metallo-hydrolase [Clostridia bacterium]
MKRFTKKLFGIIVFVIVAVIFCISRLSYFDEKFKHIDGISVIYVDVGQADCEVIMLPNGINIIIDAGKNDTEDELVEKLRGYGIQRFDYVIATHPHEDHIGGMDKVIDSFEIGCVYMPDASSNTDTFNNMLNSIENKNVRVVKAKAGVSVINEENVNMVFVAPNSDKYEETNNYSAVLKLTYGKRSFLFTGDAESASEKEMLENGMDIRADVLKVGHHGSSTSSTKDFIKAVNPEYAIIEVGEGNSYGHPHDEILDVLEGIEI